MSAEEESEQLEEAVAVVELEERSGRMAAAGKEEAAVPVGTEVAELDSGSDIPRTEVVALELETLAVTQTLENQSAVPATVQDSR